MAERTRGGAAACVPLTQRHTAHPCAAPQPTRQTRATADNNGINRQDNLPPAATRRDARARANSSTRLDSAATETRDSRTRAAAFVPVSGDDSAVATRQLAPRWRVMTLSQRLVRPSVRGAALSPQSTVTVTLWLSHVTSNYPSSSSVSIHQVGMIITSTSTAASASAPH